MNHISVSQPLTMSRALCAGHDLATPPELHGGLALFRVSADSKKVCGFALTPASSASKALRRLQMATNKCLSLRAHLNRSCNAVPLRHHSGIQRAEGLPHSSGRGSLYAGADGGDPVEACRTAVGCRSCRSVRCSGQAGGLRRRLYVPLSPTVHKILLVQG